MTASDSFWLWLVCLLAAEVTVVALWVALLQRRFAAPAWRRAFCQAGISAVLVLAAAELSGAARLLAHWAAGVLPVAKVEAASATIDALPRNPATSQNAA